ncbi:MAG: InlB B-repeat-containing protein [Treponema sp.]
MALITATLAVCFTACNQTGNTGGGGGKPTPTPKPKHAITFSVDSTTPNGTLKAKADGVPETATSPITVEEGKTVTFTATANDGYRVKGWTLDGSAVNGTNNSYSFTVSKAVSVKVSFEDNSTPLPKHAITFSVDGANGTLKAKADGVPETATSPITVEEGKTVTFTAEPSTNYKVKEWKVGDTVVTGNKTNTYAHTVTKAVTVKVSFEANSNPPTPQTKYTVTLNQTTNGKVTASPEIPADKQVAKDTEITFTAKANEGYKIGKWTVTPAEALQAGTGAEGSETAKVKITANTTVSVNFELSPVEGGAVLILSLDKLNIKVEAKTEDGSAITVEGCTVSTLASGTKTTLTATGTKVVLKGKITELDCSFNKLTSLGVQGLTSLQRLICEYNKLSTFSVQGLTSLQYLDCSDNPLTELNAQGCTALQILNCFYNLFTALNVQGCTSLQHLNCHRNKLNAQAMKELLNALPAREASDDAKAILYTEKTFANEGNCKDFTSPELEAALEGAKKRNWKLQKVNASGGWEDI